MLWKLMPGHQLYGKDDIVKRAVVCSMKVIRAPALCSCSHQGLSCLLEDYKMVHSVIAKVMPGNKHVVKVTWTNKHVVMVTQCNKPIFKVTLGNKHVVTVTLCRMHAYHLSLSVIVSNFRFYSATLKMNFLVKGTGFSNKINFSSFIIRPDFYVDVK